MNVIYFTNLVHYILSSTNLQRAQCQFYCHNFGLLSGIIHICKVWKSQWRRFFMPFWGAGNTFHRDTYSHKIYAHSYLSINFFKSKQKIIWNSWINTVISIVTYILCTNLNGKQKSLCCVFSFLSALFYRNSLWTPEILIFLSQRNTRV